MKKPDCIFCKIVGGEIPSYKIWENEEFIAFLDLFPNCKGQTLVIPKEHFDSDLFAIKDGAFYKNYLLAIDEVVALLKKKLKLERVAMVMEGMGVNHLHIKLYPLHGVEKEWKPQHHHEAVYFEDYPAYLTTKIGPEANPLELKSLAEKIRE